MMLLVSGATTTLDRLHGDGNLGRLITPENRNLVSRLHPSICGADNSALSKNGLDPDKVIKLWDQLAADYPFGLRFVAAPDAVEMTANGPCGDWNGTLWLWRSWRVALRKRRLPAAIVLQDGASVDSVPWDEIDAIFVGGSTRWKLSRTAELLIRAADARGKWVHVGRVNTMPRVRHFDPLPVDSIDGSQFSMFPDTHIPRYLDRLKYKQERMQS